ncbi:MAG: hypothetical protein AAF371_00550 [Pseudomonadota bacterium]
MTDAMTMQPETVTHRSLGARLGRELREAMAEIARLPARLAAARATYRAERDFDRIHDALCKLNKRQLGMLGLKREDIYTFTELCVFQPERRPELRIHDTGPALALTAPESALAQMPAPTEAAEVEIDAVETADFKVETPAEGAEHASTAIVEELIEEAEMRDEDKIDLHVAAAANDAHNGQRVAA